MKKKKPMIVCFLFENNVMIIQMCFEMESHNHVWPGDRKRARHGARGRGGGLHARLRMFVSQQTAPYSGVPAAERPRPEGAAQDRPAPGLLTLGTLEKQTALVVLGVFIYCLKSRILGTSTKLLSSKTAVGAPPVSLIVYPRHGFF